MKKALTLTTLVVLLALAAGPYSAVADTTKPGSESTFLDMLNEANAIVQKSYPGAEFYEADLNLQMAGSPWQFVFNDPSTKPNSTVILKNYMGKFQLPPQHVDSP